MLRNIPSSTLRQLLKLSQRKEKLMAQIQAVDREMIRLQEKCGVPVREQPSGVSVKVSETSRKAKRGRTR